MRLHVNDSDSWYPDIYKQNIHLCARLGDSQHCETDQGDYIGVPERGYSIVFNTCKDSDKPTEKCIELQATLQYKESYPIHNLTMLLRNLSNHATTGVRSPTVPLKIMTLKHQNVAPTEYDQPTQGEILYM